MLACCPFGLFYTTQALAQKKEKLGGIKKSTWEGEAGMEKEGGRLGKRRFSEKFFEVETLVSRKRKEKCFAI